MKGEEKSSIINNKKAVLKLSLISLALLVLVGVAVYSYFVLATAVVTTDKTDYSPEETVLISGSGFNPNTQITVSVTRPDSNTESENVMSDSNGAFTYNYQLDGITGTYNVVASDGTNTASTTFTDGRNIDNVKLNGVNQVTVSPNAIIDVAITVSTTGQGSNNDWQGTKYQIEGGSWTCVNTPDHTTGTGTFTEHFNITAPSNPGTYDVHFKAYDDDDCDGDGSNEFHRWDGIIVQSQAQCDSGLCCNANHTFKSAGTTCRDSAGACDIAETCTGQSATCPADTKSTAQCRTSAGQCDVAEYCDGINNNCPANGYAPFSTGCDDGLFCSETDHCDGNGNCVLLTNRTCNSPPNSCYLPQGSCTEKDHCVYTFSDGQGPVTSALTLIHVPISGVCWINIEANETDQCSNIAAAEYFFGSCPNNNTRGTAMDPKDENFNSLIEAVMKNNVNSGISDGSLTVYVRGKDAQGNWGACDIAAIDMDCNPPGYPTCVEGGVKGIMIDGICNANEKLVCGNNPLVKANICDVESRIQLAEYFIDKDCKNNRTSCLDWTGINMTASDENYNDSCEDVQAYVNLSLLSEGTHYVMLHGKDGAENWGKFILPPVASFIKDTKAPITNKTIDFAGEGDPNVICQISQANNQNITNGCYYVRSGTQITLTAQDQDTPDHEIAGNVTTHYKIWIGDDCDSNNPEDWTVLTEGTGNTVTLNEDSCHLVEYWSTDGCGNPENKHYELDIVDNKGPTITKTVGTPSVLVDSECNPQVEDCDYYIRQDTPITFNCVDQEPHPVDDVTIVVKVHANETGLNTTYQNNSNTLTINIGEDSTHIVTYYCMDKLMNIGELHREIMYVDTVAPVINKTLIGPYSGDCLPEDREDVCFIDGVTQIQIIAIDPTPHPVDNVKCDWDYTVTDGQKVGSGQQNVIPPFTINFPEESHHVLTITCKDALGNQVTDVEDFYVDKTPPTTTKEYGKPFITDGTSDWITSQTQITLSAEDTGPHKSGIVGTFYRITLLGSDDACLSDSVCQQQTGTGGFLNYTESPFTIAQESCHLIEFYSKDNVMKTEQIKKQCVFVDNSAPLTNKGIGTPQYPCNEGEEKCGDEEANWPAKYVNQSTPITLSCTDPQPHPVDHEKLCYKISWDVREETTYPTEAYCSEFGGEMNDGYCCDDVSEENYQFHFMEDSLHNIEWYCKDALGNAGDVNLEYDNIDSQPPHIIIYNPSFFESWDIKRCDQSIVVEVWDEKSGVNDSSIYAILVNESGTVKGPVYLKKAIYTHNGHAIYEGLMDKQLPAGEYTLQVFASDNLGTQGMEDRDEKLKSGVYVEFIDPASCVVNQQTGGSCLFTFHVCARNTTSISFWMTKLGEDPKLITPDMLNAMISANGNSTFVGLWDGMLLTDPSLLDLSNGQKVNGKATFNLTLTLNSNITNMIGSGIQDLKYKIKSYDP